MASVFTLSKERGQRACIEPMQVEGCDAQVELGRAQENSRPPLERVALVVPPRSKVPFLTCTLA